MIPVYQFILWLSPLIEFTIIVMIIGLIVSFDKENRDENLGKILTIGAVLASIGAVLYFIWSLVKKKQSDGRRNVNADYRVKE